MNPRSHAAPPFRLRARRTPDLAARKRPRPTPHPRRMRLKALTACGGRRFPGHSVGRALRLTRGAACSAQQPRRTARNSRVPSPSPAPSRTLDEREVYSDAVLRGERGRASGRSGKPLKIARIPGFPQCGQILSIVCGKIRKYFSIACVEKQAGCSTHIFLSMHLTKN